MRSLIGILVAGLILTCSVRESCALSLTEAQRQLGVLEAVLTAQAKPIVEPRGETPYYDVLVQHVCDDVVENLARQWLNEAAATFFNRALLIEASVSFPDSGRHDLDAVIFVGGNTSDSPWKCQSSIVQGVRNTDRVRVTLKMIVASELGPKTSTVLAGALAAAAGLVTEGWGAVVVGTLAGATKAYAGETKDINQKLLANGGKTFHGLTVELGATSYGDKRRPTSNVVAGASFSGNGQEWFALHRQPRNRLIDFNPLWDSPTQKIPQQIDLVSVYLGWDDMLKEAHFDALNWSQPRAVTTFCNSFRAKLERSLQGDVTAVQLGLYAHFVQYRGQFSGDRAHRGCLETSELNGLGLGVIF